MGLIKSKNYKIKFSEIDFKDEIKPWGIINIFQNLAMEQTEDLGVGFQYLNENKLKWVIYQWDIEIKELPNLNQEIVISTEPKNFGKIFAYREFLIRDKKGTVLIKGNSEWLILDGDTLAMKKIPKELSSIYGVENKKLPRIKEGEHSETIDAQVSAFKVSYSDIDPNMHANNEKYFEWAFDSIDFDFLRKHKLKSIKAVYKKELKHGDDFHVETSICGKRVSQIFKNDDEVCFILNLIFV